MKRVLALAGLSLGLTVLASDAAAVISAPVTLGGYSGVASSTTRRSSSSSSSSSPGATVGTSGSAATGSSSTIMTLPSGCTDFSKAGVTYKKCGQVYYRPTYQGTNLVYVTATP
jgi:hypothetical protein